MKNWLVFSAGFQNCIKAESYTIIDGILGLYNTVKKDGIDTVDYVAVFKNWDCWTLEDEAFTLGDDFMEEIDEPGL